MLDQITLISLLFGLVASFGGAITWWRAAVRKQYAAERDFNHLKRNYEQMSANIAALVKDSDGRFDHIDLELVEIKAILSAHLGQAKERRPGRR
ncbi:MAG: hypothetical protein F6J97_13090 [Leptolyngbya sp. SIO4C1]|nr:hypothetical protein [Leptolyngbya sp. SIO4C1]